MTALSGDGLRVSVRRRIFDRNQLADCIARAFRHSGAANAIRLDGRLAVSKR
jgi:hypothetical protein